MKRISILCVWLLAAALSFAQGPDEQYIGVHRLVEDADQLAANGQTGQALAKYTEANKTLERFQRDYPTWNPEVVKFRLSYLAGKIATLSAEAPAATASTNAPTPAPPPIAPETVTRLQQEISVLKEELRQAASDRALLDAKLKEATAALPPAADTLELNMAQERIKTLELQIEDLKIALQKARAQSGSPSSNPALAPQPKPPEPKIRDQARQSFEQTRQALADANLRLAEETEKNAVLEAKLKDLSPATASQPAGSGESQRVRALITERDDLKRKLDGAMRQLAERTPTGSKGTPAASGDMATELVTLRTKMALYESRAVPYTAEELAFIRKPEAKLASVPTPQSAPPRRDPPAGGAALAAEAQRYFTARQFDKAEGSYLQLLHQDPDNVFTLGNLGATELELGKLDESQRNLQHALTLAPDDAFVLAMMGHLKYRQSDYDGALEVLGRAAQLDPQNPEVQNYLGVTFGQKGMRQQAESALRKAVQLAPNYADAHNNLAWIYLNQQPPLTELARWHYQKALAAGSPPRPELEKRLETKSPAAGGQ